MALEVWGRGKECQIWNEYFGIPRPASSHAERLYTLSKPAFFLIKNMPVRHRRSIGCTPPYLF